MNYNISFIVPVYNEDKTILQCIDSIKSVMQDGDEVIVVDNGSVDDTLSKLQNESKIILCEYLHGNISSVRNYGASLAKNEILAFIDADCVLCEGWRKGVVEAFSQCGVSATGSKVLVPENSNWIVNAWFSQRKQESGEVNYINSGNFIIKKEVFKSIGGFDGELITGEDAEICLRLKKANHLIYANPNIKSLHLDNPSSLYGFLKKEYWHGLGALGTVTFISIDKPFFMTLMFLFFPVFTILFLFISGFEGIVFAIFIVISIFFVPIVTSFYRSFQYNNHSYILHLSVLYTFYYIARLLSLIVSICQKIKKLAV